MAIVKMKKLRVMAMAAGNVLQPPVDLLADGPGLFQGPVTEEFRLAHFP